MSRYAGRIPADYAQAVAALRGKDERNILNNTYVIRTALDQIEVRYHGNTIATFHEDGTREFTTCGWNTTSTRERLNGMLWNDHIGFTQQSYVGYVMVRLADGTYQKHHADTLEIQPNGSINSITNSRES